MGILLPGIAQGRVAARFLAPLIALTALLGCVLCAVWASSASAVGYPGNLVELTGDCGLKVGEMAGQNQTASGADVSSASLGDGTIQDDGTIKTWRVAGFGGPADSVELDVLPPGMEDKVIAESGPGLFEEIQNTTNILVKSGERIGVTLRAGGDPNTEETEAEVHCGGSVLGRFGNDKSVFGLWVPALLGSARVPNLEGGGWIAVDADVTFDKPVITSASQSSGPSHGGQEITVKGEHLANVEAVELGEQNFAETIKDNTNSEFTFITPEALKEGNLEVQVFIAGGEGKFKYEYSGGEVPSRVPVIDLEAASSITSTSAVLNAAVDTRGLSVEPAHCIFTYGPGEAEGEEEEYIPCSSATFENNLGAPASPIAATISDLIPGTTYGYKILANNTSGPRGALVDDHEERFFKTLTAGEEAETKEEKAKEEKTKEEKAKEEKAKGEAGDTGGSALSKELASIAIAPAPSPLIPHISNTFTAPPAKVSKKGLLTFPLSAPGPGTFTALATVAGGAAHASIAKAKSVRYGAASVKVTQAGAVNLKISPSKAAIALLKRKHRLLLHVTLTFTPTSGTATTHVVSVLVH